MGKAKKALSRVVSSAELQSIVADNLGKIQKLVDGIMPKRNTQDRAMFADIVSMYAQGALYSDIADKYGATTWGKISSAMGAWPAYAALINSARAQGEEIQKQARLNAAHKRAVQGYDENVYFQGVLCGTQKRFSDRLLELLLKADDPRFRASDASVTVNVATKALMDELVGSNAASRIGIGKAITVPSEDITDVLPTENAPVASSVPSRPIPRRKLRNSGNVA